MNYIVALQGASRTGKTTTYNLLRQKLMASGYIPELGKFRPTTNHGDFIDVLKKNNKLIGISSAGDFPNWLNAAIIELKKDRCSIIFTACRTKGSTVEVIEDHGSGPISKLTDYISIYKTKWDAGTAKANEAVFNQRDSQLLFEISEQLIK